jgi:hypothetical protein
MQDPNKTPNPDKVVLTYIVIIILLVFSLSFITGCKSKEVLVETSERVEETVSIDSVYKSKYDSLLSVSNTKESAFREYITIIERELARRITGSSGSKDTAQPKRAVQNLLLTSGLDTLRLNGVWKWIDYDWQNYPCESVYRSKIDSTNSRISHLQTRLTVTQRSAQEWKGKYLRLAESSDSNVVVKDWWFAIRLSIIAVGITLLVVYFERIKDYILGFFR